MIKSSLNSIFGAYVFSTFFFFIDFQLRAHPFFNALAILSRLSIRISIIKIKDLEIDTFKRQLKFPAETNPVCSYFFECLTSIDILYFILCIQGCMMYQRYSCFDEA